MTRSFNFSAASLKEPRVLIRIGLGLLLAANLVAAGFAFHLFSPSPEALTRQLMAANAQFQAEQTRLTRSRLIAANIGRGKNESDVFLAKYFTTRRHTYSTIISEITDIAMKAGMKTGDVQIAPLDPIEGTDDLAIMTISVNIEGGFAQLVKLINMLDRSPRFLIIESMQASPQPKGDVVNANLKLDAFIKDDTGDKL
jgi:Tfp pilus assembly protein PilO